ncbi:MAG: hypothetical protein CUN55_20595 [Phototrophicales bacterium]|nr:MAG: hypothetical protein CUN55_20595 [Phototrophicales bacterium]
MLAHFAGPSLTFLNMIGKQMVVFYITLTAFVVNVLLNVALIPLWGIRGAAVATVVSIIFMSWASTIFSIKRLKVDLSWLTTK